MRTTTQLDFESLYPTSVIRGARIARLGEKYLGPVAMNARTCRAMGRDQTGWFIGGVPSYDRMVENVRRVNSADVGGRWIVVPATRYWAEVAYEQWFEDPFSDSVTTMWQDDLVTFCVPERLAELGKAINAQEVPVAGIILLDPSCIVHRGRSFNNAHSRVAHDRPQLIVDFRAGLTVDDWSPPLLIMSQRRAAAVSAQNVTRVYCLESMHFVEGASLSCGAIGNDLRKKSNEPGQHDNALVTNG